MDNVRRVSINCDGGCNGYAGIIRDADSKEEIGRYCHVEEPYEFTTNENEYRAVLRGIEETANILGSGRDVKLRIYSDSKLIVNQLNGRYRIFKKHLAGWVNRVHEVSRQFLGVEFRWVPRTQNEEADGYLREQAEAMNLPEKPDSMAFLK